MYVEADHVRQWISDHGAFLVETSVSGDFEDFISGLQWLPSRLDWSAIDHIQFEMSEDWEDRIGGVASISKLGPHGYLVIMYNGSEPSIVCPTGDGLRDIDLIYSGSPGVRYFCGADIVEDVVVPNFHAYAEFDGFGKVTFRAG